MYSINVWEYLRKSSRGLGGSVLWTSLIKGLEGHAESVHANYAGNARKLGGTRNVHGSCIMPAAWGGSLSMVTAEAICGVIWRGGQRTRSMWPWKKMLAFSHGPFSYLTCEQLWPWFPGRVWVRNSIQRGPLSAWKTECIRYKWASLLPAFAWCSEGEGSSEHASDFYRKTFILSMNTLNVCMVTATHGGQKRAPHILELEW